MLRKFKGNKLEYAYVVSDAQALYPILGSVVRAIGKGWKVIVIAPEKYLQLFETFKKLLKATNSLEIITFSQFVSNDFNHETHFDLTLSLYSDVKSNHFMRNSLLVIGKTHVMTIDEKPNSDEYDLISDFKQFKLHDEGVIAITGTKEGGGKGKTTTALGIAAEEFIKDGKVAVVQWFKEKKLGELTWAINEHFFPEKIKCPEMFSFYPTGAGFVGSPDMDRVAEESEHKRKAQDGIELAKKMILSEEYRVIVLDEFVDTLQEVMSYLPFSLLEIKEVQNLLELASKSKTIVVVTGRQVTASWSSFVSQHIIISEIKHPWSSKKQGAISGLDF